MQSEINVNAKVSRSFLKLFKDAKDLEWSEKRGRFRVEFKLNGRKNIALFEKNGYLIYHMSYGGEKDLPANIRKQIKANPYYYEHNITRAINVHQDGRDIWVVYLQDEKTMVTLRMENGDLEEVERYRKSL